MHSATAPIGERRRKAPCYATRHYVLPSIAHAAATESADQQLALDGVMVIGDAAFTFRAIIEAIREQGGGVLFVGAGRPALEGEIARAFGGVFPRKVIAAARGQTSSGVVRPTVTFRADHCWFRTEPSPAGAAFTEQIWRAIRLVEQA